MDDVRTGDPEPELGDPSLAECIPLTDYGSTFTVEVRKQRQEPLGITLEEHDGAIIVRSIFPDGSIARTNSGDNHLATIKQGDILAALNGATDIESIMSQIFASTFLQLDLIRGPFVLRHPSVPSVQARSCSSDIQEDVSCVEGDGARVGNVLCNAQLESLREQDNADRRQISAGIGQQELSQLIADRLARSRRDRT